MKVDMSDYAIGELLSIECKNGQQRPVAYMLKSLNKAKRNYIIYNKEMLTVIRILENQRCLLESTKFKFEI